MVILFLVSFEGTFIQLSIMAVLNYTPIEYKCSIFSTSSSTLVIFHHFLYYPLADMIERYSGAFKKWGLVRGS
jgi:hypothetical protein